MLFRSVSYFDLDANGGRQEETIEVTVLPTELIRRAVKRYSGLNLFAGNQFVRWVGALHDQPEKLVKLIGMAKGQYVIQEPNGYPTSGQDGPASSPVLPAVTRGSVFAARSSPLSGDELKEYMIGKILASADASSPVSRSDLETMNPEDLNRLYQASAAQRIATQASAAGPDHAVTPAEIGRASCRERV